MKRGSHISMNKSAKDGLRKKNFNKFICRRKYNINWLLFVTLILAIAGIVAITFFSCNFAYVLALKVSFNSETASVSVLLSAGLSIIGIAIAIWAALNITNAINRGDIEDLKNTLYDLKNTTEIIKPYIHRNKNIQFELFLVELGKSSNDPIVDYLANWFKNNYSDDIPYSELTLIELKFSQARSRHRSRYHYDPVLITTASHGLNIIDIVHDMLNGKLGYTKNYLEYRKCEFLFFMGYCESEKRVGADHFYKAAKGYLQYSNLFGVNFQDQPDSAAKYRTAYLSNTIGESFSKIVHYYLEERERLESFCSEIDEIANKAVGYCKSSTELLSNEQQASTYFRNLGCAYERLDDLGDGFHNVDDAIQSYKKAFELLVDEPAVSRANTINTYYALLSYYGKIILSHITNRNKWNLDKIETAYQPSVSLANPEEAKKIKCHISDMYSISQIAMDDFPNSMIIAKLYCESCCFILLAIKNGIDFSNSLVINRPSFYLNEIKSVIIKCDIMKTMDRKDNFATTKLDTIKCLVNYFDLHKMER